jgi:hypothetical protein
MYQENRFKARSNGFWGVGFGAGCSTQNKIAYARRKFGLRWSDSEPAALIRRAVPLNGLWLSPRQFARPTHHSPQPGPLSLVKSFAKTHE